MRRTVAVLALSILPAVGLAQDSLDSDSGDIVFQGGAVEASGEEGGRPTCACAGVGPTDVPALAAFATLAAGYWMSRSTRRRSTPH